MVSTGLSVAAAQKNNMSVEYTDYEDLQRPGFMKENAKVKIRIVYESDSRRIVGAQMASTEDISMGIHMFSLAIEEGVTIDKLENFWTFSSFLISISRITTLPWLHLSAK